MMALDPDTATTLERVRRSEAGARPAMSFQEFDGRTWQTRREFPGMRVAFRSLVAFTEDGGLAGEIRWSTRGGEIALIWVPDHLQRRGIATALLREAIWRQPDVHHSTQLTSDAQAWIEGLRDEWDLRTTVRDVRP
jgi:GNAT superfamily N-acetyltransferase